MPHWSGYLNVAVAATDRYDETEERLILLYPLLLKFWRFFPTGKESRTLFSSQRYFSSTNFCKIKHIFPNGKIYQGHLFFFYSFFCSFPLTVSRNRTGYNRGVLASSKSVSRHADARAVRPYLSHSTYRTEDGAGRYSEAPILRLRLSVRTLSGWHPPWA